MSDCAICKKLVTIGQLVHLKCVYHVTPIRINPKTRSVVFSFKVELVFDCAIGEYACHSAMLNCGSILDFLLINGKPSINNHSLNWFVIT